MEACKGLIPSMQYLFNKLAIVVEVLVKIKAEQQQIMRIHSKSC